MYDCKYDVCGSTCTYNIMYIHEVCIVHFYVFLHVCIHVFMPMCIIILCVKQCCVGVSETCRLILKIDLFVLFLDKHA